MAHSTPSSTLETLTRLSSKPNVRATLIVSRATGAVVQSTGLPRSSSSAPASAPVPTPVSVSSPTPAGGSAAPSDEQPTRSAVAGEESTAAEPVVVPQPQQQQQPQSPTDSYPTPAPNASAAAPSAPGGPEPQQQEPEPESDKGPGPRTAEQVAALVMGLVAAAGNFAEGMKEDEDRGAWKRRPAADKSGGGREGYVGESGGGGTSATTSGTAAVEVTAETADVQLLRVRTGQREVVVVPDSKFLLVVIHDIPKAGS